MMIDFKPKKEKKFNLVELEDNLRGAYSLFSKKANEKSRTEIFLAIKALSFAILSVSKQFKKLDNIEVISYEYALYLFERLAIGKFKPKAYDNGRFPWQMYIAKNIRHVVYNMRDDFFWRDQIKDMEFLVDEAEAFDDYIIDEIQTQYEETFIDIFRVDMSDKLIKALKMFYCQSEIDRLMPLTLEILSESNSVPILHHSVPKDVTDFYTVLISLVKRQTRIENKGLFKNKDKLLSSAIRSSVFLSTISNSEIFPRELFLSLDIDSLFRLSQTLGGKVVKIPTERQLNSLLGAVVAVSKIITEGKSAKKCMSEAKAEYDLVFTSGININDFISNIVDSLDVFSEDEPTEPIINLLIQSLGNLEGIMDRYLDASLDSEEFQHCNRKLKEKITDLRSTLDSLERRIENV